MSDLRKHLQSEKERHQVFVYPGNLAAEILGAEKVRPASVMDYADSALRRRRSPLWVWILGFGSLAAAALLAVAIFMHRTSPTATLERPAAMANEDEEQAPIAPTSTASINDIEGQTIVPSGMESPVPQYQSMTFPTVPSFSDLSTTDTTQTSQEPT
jgi:hypothetical protein